VAKIDTFLPAKSVKSPEKIHFALSVNFFMGNMWKQQISRGDNPQGLTGSSITALNKAGKGLMGNKLLEGTNGVEFSLSPSDDIAKELSRGAVDVAFMPGEDFAFLHESYPDLEPLGYGNLSDSLTGGGDFTHEPLQFGSKPKELNAFTQSVVLVRDNFDSNPNKLSPTPMPLKGLRLAVYPMRSHSMTFLSQWIRRWEPDGPEGFFNTSKENYTSPQDAIESLIEKDGKVAADVVVVSLETWKMYRYMKPGASLALKVFSASPKSFPPVLVYSKKALRPEIEETLEDFFVRPKSKENQQFTKVISPFVGMAIGVSDFSMANSALVTSLKNHLKETEDFTHYLLPVFFFPRAAHWSQE
jgi:hypothetical protein